LGVEGLKKSIIVLILIVVICAIAVASWFVMQPSQINNTTNVSNITNKSSATPNSTINNTTVSQDNNQNGNNNPPPSSVSADEAKDLAKKYVGPNVILGKPVMTTYKQVHAWQVPVYTVNHKFINNIYINERTGQKVN
jgi:cytoskeletal protein RodZ